MTELALLLPFAAVALWFALRIHFFFYPEQHTFKVSGLRVLGALFLYFVVGHLLVALLLILHPSHRVIKGSLFLLPGLLLLLVGPLWQRNRRPFWRPLLFGASSLLIAWPITTLLALLLTLGLTAAGLPVTEERQIAIEVFRQIIGDPILLPLALLSTLLFTPWMEELLFRGFIQGWLRRYLPRQPAIWITAVLFSALHFAPAQRYANVVILPAVLGLGWFLGHLYEREGTLAAPIGLHILYNCVGIFHEVLTSIIE